MTLLTANETLHVIVNTHYKKHLERIQKLINEAIEKDHGAIALPYNSAPGPVRAYLRSLGYSERAEWHSEATSIEELETTHPPTLHYIYDIYT